MSLGAGDSSTKYYTCLHSNSGNLHNAVFIGHSFVGEVRTNQQCGFTSTSCCRKLQKFTKISFRSRRTNVSRLTT